MAQKDGFLFPLIAGGTEVEKGQVVAQFEGENLCAPVNGTLLAMAKPGYLFNGDRIFTIAPFWKEEAKRKDV